MSKIKINEREYARLVNEKMKEHDFYSNEMSVEVTPEDSEKPSGLKMNGPNEVRAVVSWAKSEIEKEYEVVLTQ